MEKENTSAAEEIVPLTLLPSSGSGDDVALQSL